MPARAAREGVLCAGSGQMTSNNALDRTVSQRGAPLRREVAACAAAQLGR